MKLLIVVDMQKDFIDGSLGTQEAVGIVENVKDNLHQNIYKTIIPRNIRLAEAPSYGMPITVYDPRSKGAKCYDKLGKELIKNNEEPKAKHMK